MLEELKLSNFRVFDDEVTVRFRPITVLIGKNNAGKSSIIKFLLMLKQSIGQQGNFFNTSGEHTALGRFYELGNKTSQEQNLTFSLRVNDNSSPHSILWQYLKDNEIDQEERTYTVQASVTYSRKGFVGKEQKMIFEAGDRRPFQTVSDISPNSSFLDFRGGRVRSPSIDMNIQMPIQQFCIDTIHTDLNHLKHLSAMRDELRGVFRTHEFTSNKNVGSKGESTIFELWKEEILKTDEAEFFKKHAREILGIDNIKFTELSDLIGCDAKNAVTGTTFVYNFRVDISHFGFGVSQCLPILVQGVLMPNRSQIIVEQPEAQIHPTAQLAIGSFFAELWKEFKVGSIIETHSDNILLKLRRLIAKKELKADEVSVVYFDIVNDKPSVKNLDINPDGSMEPGLPIEFFHANIREAGKMRAGK